MNESPLDWGAVAVSDAPETNAQAASGPLSWGAKPVADSDAKPILEQYRKDQNAGFAQIERLYDNIDTLGGAWNQSLQYAYEPLMGDNIQEGKARFANQALLAFFKERRPEEIGGAGYEILRNQYARENFNGNMPKTDLEFYNAYRAKRDKDRVAEQWERDVYNQGVAAGLKSAVAQQAPDWGRAMGDVFAPGTEGGPTFTKVSDDPATAGGSLDDELNFGLAYSKAHRLVSEHPELAAVTQAFMKAAGRADLSAHSKLSLTDITGTTLPGQTQSPQFDGNALIGVADELIKLPREVRKQYLDLIPAWMAAEGVKDPQEGLSRIAAAVFQSADASARGADKAWGSRRDVEEGDLQSEAVLSALDKGEEIRVFGDRASLSNVMTLRQYRQYTVNRGVSLVWGVAPPIGLDAAGERLFYESSRPLSTQEKEEVGREALQTHEKYQTARDIYRLANETVNPIRPTLATSKLGQAAEMAALYGTAEFAPVMIASGVAGAVHPSLGWAVMADAMKSQYYNDARDAGMSAESADSYSSVASGIAAGAGMLRISALKGGGWLAMRFPGLRAAIADATVPSGRYALPFLGRAALGSVEQAADMSAMAAAPEAAKWLTQGLAQDIPKTQFSQITDAMAHSMSDPGTWFAALPFALVGAGVAGFGDFREVDASLADKGKLQRAGFSMEYQDKIIEAYAAGDLEKARDLYREGYAVRGKQDIIAGQELRRRDEERSLAVPQSPLTPTLRQEGDRWAVIGTHGEKTFFESEDSAQMFIKDREQWRQEHEDQAISGFIDLFTKEDEKKGVENRQWEKRDQEKTLQDALNAGEETPEQVAESMDIAGVKAGNPADARVYGENIPTVAGNLYTDVSRIYKGADWSDVVHERGHSEHQLARHEGRLTAADEEAATRVWMEREGGTAPEKLSERHIKEAFADLYTAHVAGQLKKGTALWNALPQAVRVFLSQLKAYFSGVFKKAAQLEALRKEGKLPKNVEEFLAQSLKIDEQINHDAGVKKEVEKMVGKPLEEAAGVAGERSFSVGKIKDRSDVWKKPDVAVVKIDSSKIEGGSKDWRKTIRQWFSKELQGQVITNDHSGLGIKFTAESKAEAPSKLRKEEAVRTLKSAASIVKEALYLDSSKATDSDSNAYHYFVVPVEVDGKIHSAWFNVREPKAKDPKSDGIFYEFGVDTKNEALPHPKKEPRVDSENLASTEQPHLNTTEFLEAVKGGIANHIPPKPGAETSHSIGTKSYMERIQAQLDAMLKTPEEVALFQEKAKENLSLLSGDGGLLARLTRLDQKKTEREAKLELDIENRRADLERDIEALHQQRDEQISKAGEANTIKYGDRIEAAKTNHERKLLEREAKESAADVRRGIEKDFKRQERALKEKAKTDERAMREKALGKDRADEAAADFEDRHQATLEALKVFNSVLMAVPPDERGRIGGFVTLASLKTDAARIKYIEDRIGKIQDVLEKSLRRQYGEAMKKLFKRSQPKKDKAGKAPVGKLGADVHALFRQMEEAMDWTPEKAAAHADSKRSEIEGGELTPEQEAAYRLEAGMVELVSDWKNADATRRAAAVENATRIFKEGYGDELIKTMERRAARKETRQQLIAGTGKEGTLAEINDKQAEAQGKGALGKLKGAKAKIEGIWYGITSFEQTVKTAFGDSSKDGQAIADREREADYKKTDLNQETSFKVNQLFSDLAGGFYKGQVLHWNMTRMTLKVREPLKGAEIKLSELQAITATLMWRQEDGRRHMEGIKDENGSVVSGWHYNQDFIDQIEKQLSPEAKSLREWFVREYGGEYGLINPLFRKLNGVDLPRHLDYAPLTVKPLNDKSPNLDPVTGFEMSGASATPGSLRTRGHSVSQPDFKDALVVFMQHKAQINHWLGYGELARDMRSILGNREVLNAVEARGGQALSDALRGWTDYLIQGGNRDASARLELTGLLSRMTSRAASIALVGRLGVLPLQSTQLGAALCEMPTTAYSLRLGKLLSGNLGWGEAIRSPYIQRRLKEMPPLVRQAMEGLMASKPSQLKHAMQKVGQTISGADALFTAGTYAIVRDYRLTQILNDHPGLSRTEAEAMATKEAERITDRLAQPVRPGARSLYEVNATNPATRMLWNFASDARKNLGVLTYALAQRPAMEKLRTMAFVLLITPIASAAIRAMWRDARDDEDNEWFDEKHWNPKRFALAVATEPIQGLPILGPMMQDAIYKGAGEYRMGGDLLSSIPNSVPAAKRLLTGDEDDFEHTMRDVESVLAGMGLLNSDIAAAASLSHLVRDLYGVEQNATK